MRRDNTGAAVPSSSPSPTSTAAKPTENASGQGMVPAATATDAGFVPDLLDGVLTQQPTSDFVADDFEATSSLLVAQRGQTIEVVNQASRLMTAIAVGGVTAVITLVACSGSAEGTVVAKVGPVFDYGSCATGNVVGPMGVATRGSCSGPTCWQLDIRESSGNMTGVCVRRELYDAAQLGTFWHGPTDR